MLRRRMMMAKAQEVEEMKEWVELLNERERTVTDSQNVEFDLATNESHSEYWISFIIAKHTGENTVNGQVIINLNGAQIGYYMLAQDYSKNPVCVDMHVYMQPIGSVDYARSTSSINTNSVQIMRNRFVGKESGTGKLTFRFPAKYTGIIKEVRILAR